MAAYVYIMASERNGTIYVGVSSNIRSRSHQHKESSVGGFTRKYGVDKLVYHELFDDIRDAIQREKNIKKWPRKWKLELIEKHNPTWRDLYEDLNK